MDNLKLGYSGTASEMARLINDSGVLGDSVQVTAETVKDVPFDKVIEAIHEIQTKLGITGTSSEEAAKTIQGSMAMTKAAWENLLIALANPGEDITQPIQDLINAIVGEGEGEGLINQLLPAVEAVLTGIGQLIEQAAPELIDLLLQLLDENLPKLLESSLSILDSIGQLIEQVVPELLDIIPQLLDENLPKLLESCLSILDSIIQALTQNADKIGEFITSLVLKFSNFVIQNLPKIIKVGMTILTSLLTGLANAMPELIPAIIKCIGLIVDTITDPDTLSKIITASLDIVLAIVEGIVNNLEKIVNAVLQLIENVQGTLIKPEVLTKIITASFKLLLAVVQGIAKAGPDIIKALITLIGDMSNQIIHTDWGSVGKNIIDGLLNGLKGAWNNLTSWWNDGINSIVDGAKNLLGIHSPSRVFAGIGKNVALGFGEGWKDEIGEIKDGMESDLDFDNNITTVPSNVGAQSQGGRNGGWTIMLNIDQFINNTDKDIETLTDMILETMNEKTVREGAVYA